MNKKNAFEKEETKKEREKIMIKLGKKKKQILKSKIRLNSVDGLIFTRLEQQKTPKFSYIIFINIHLPLPN